MRLAVLVALICLLSGVSASGQTFYGSVVGTVSDSSGSAVPQANVTLINMGTQERRNVAADESGNYQFVNLNPGQYRVEIEKIGFRKFVREPITVEVQSAVRIDVSMQLGDVNQVIEVTAQTPILQTEDQKMLRSAR
jgi:hypothetical protein